MQFQTTTGSATIQGQAGAGTRVGTITVGRGSSATDTGTARAMSLAGHNVTVMANNVILGHLNGSTGGTTRGNLTFDTGTFDVNNLTIAQDQAGTAPNGAGGTFTLGTDATSTGSLIVNTSFLMGNVSNGATGAKPTCRRSPSTAAPRTSTPTSSPPRTPPPPEPPSRARSISMPAC
jgi:hypothetical protein